TGGATLRVVFPTRVGVNQKEDRATLTPLEVFPTRVGVNRIPGLPSSLHPSFPHTRGGEPHTGSVGRVAGMVFPTRVGVNRSATSSISSGSSFSPHAWG